MRLDTRPWCDAAAGCGAAYALEAIASRIAESTLRAVIRSRVAVVVAAASLSLAGCGASDGERVARVWSPTHALATGAAQAVRGVFGPGTAAAGTRRGSLCAHLRDRAAQLTPAERQRLAAARAALVRVVDDRATGFLQSGECVLATSGSVLARNDDGEWHIVDSVGVDSGAEGCLNS